MIEILVYVLYATLYILAFYKQKNALFLFILFLPLRSFIDAHVLGVFFLNQPFTFILLFHFIKNGYVNKFISIKNQYINPIVIFYLFFIIISYYVNTRESILLEDYLESPMNLKRYITTFITEIVPALCLILILYLLYYKNQYKKIVINALILSSVIVILSMFFSPILIDLGINIRGAETSEYFSHSLSNVGREAGLFTGGDVNSAVTFLNLIFAYTLINSLILNYSIKFKEYIFLLIVASGILFAASRMGFVMMIFTTIYSILLIQKKNIKSLIKNFLFISVALISIGILLNSLDRFDLIFERIADKGIGQEINPETGYRFLRWLEFIDFTTENLKTMLFGANKLLYVYGNFEWRDPHSLFVNYFFFSGLLIIIPLIYFIIKLINNMKKICMLKQSLPVIIIQLISFAVISSHFNIHVFVLLISLLIFNNKSINKPIIHH